LRELAGGAHAVAVFNRGAKDANVTVSWKEPGMRKTPKKARDLWMHRDLPVAREGFSGNVPAHGVVMWRVSE
jgi:alpha-galactosidase